MSESTVVACDFCGQRMVVGEIEAHLATHGIRDEKKPASVTAPPPLAARNPFVNLQFLVTNGGTATGTIISVRDGREVVSRDQQKAAMYTNRMSWIVDVKLDKPATVLAQNPGGQGNQAVSINVVSARIGEGDIRHRRAWDKLRANWIGARVQFRLPTVEDVTKASWVWDII